ncbi:hypothetical protein Tco_0408383 [Tanacetum coccineum]
MVSQKGHFARMQSAEGSQDSHSTHIQDFIMQIYGMIAVWKVIQIRRKATSELRLMGFTTDKVDIKFATPAPAPPAYNSGVRTLEAQSKVVTKQKQLAYEENIQILKSALEDHVSTLESASETAVGEIFITPVPTSNAVPAGRPTTQSRLQEFKGGNVTFGGGEGKITRASIHRELLFDLLYAISHDPFIYDSLVKQFWRTASLRLAELGPPAIVATIDGAQYTISEASEATFHESPPRSHEATPSAGQPSGVVADPLTLTALSSLVSKFMQKKTSLESQGYQKDTWNCYNYLGWESQKAGSHPLSIPSKDNDSGSLKTQDIAKHLLQLLTILSQTKRYMLRASCPSLQLKLISCTPGNHAISTIELEDERLGWEAAERLHAQEQAELERQQEELLRQDELLAPKIQANEELSRTLIGSNLPKEDFASAMVEMVDRKRSRLLNKRLKLEGIDLYFTRASKRLGDELEQPSSKRSKPAEVEATSAAMEDTERTPRKRKSVARKGLHISKSTIPIETGDPDAEHKMCLKYASNEEDDSDCDTLVPFYAVVDWELLPTGLGHFYVIYRKDNSLKYFTSLREILHLVTREDLMTIYGRVVTYYQNKEADGVGLILWGDLRVLIDSLEVDDGSEFWKSQHKGRIKWKF